MKQRKLKKYMMALFCILILSLSGCQNKDNFNLSKICNAGKYVTIDYVEGATFDVRKIDYGIDRTRNPEQDYTEENGLPVENSYYEGYFLNKNQKYVYFYRNNIGVNRSLADVNDIDDFKYILNNISYKVGDFNCFFDEMSDFVKIENKDNIKCFCNVKFYFSPEFSAEYPDKECMYGYATIVEKDGRFYCFIFGGKEGLISDDEYFHILSSFEVGDGNFYLTENDLKTEEISLVFDKYTINGDFPICFNIDENGNWENHNYEGINYYYNLSVYFSQKGAGMNYSLDSYISGKYEDYTEIKRIIDKSGNEWICLETPKEYKELVYLTFIDGKVLTIKMFFTDYDEYSLFINAMDKAISTVTVENSY